MIKVKSLAIVNVGLIAHETIEFNKPLLLFYGDVRQGKTTILNAVKWVLGAPWPSDLIRHGEKVAEIRLAFDGGSVSRSWYVGKDAQTKARDIVFIRDNRPVERPAKEIARLLNPFVSNQDYLRNMGEAQRLAFLCELFALDTTELDAEASACTSQASQLRSEIKAYGEMALGPEPEVPEVEVLRAQIDVLKEQYANVMRSARQEQDRARLRDTAIELARTECHRLELRRQDLVNEIAKLDEQLHEKQQWFVLNPPLAEVLVPEPPEAIEYLSRQLNEAAVARERLVQWEKEKFRWQRRDDAQKQLRELEARERAIKEQKAATLKNCLPPIAGLGFDEDGKIVFEQTTAGMLSTSQLMRLSSALAGLYPPGFGLELLDRGESLGKSIYEFIDKAKAKDLTILAAIVGEAPAQSPPEVGVFVVEQGKISKPKQGALI